MKKFIPLFTVFSISILLFSCSSNSVSDEFEEANGAVDVKLMKSMTLSSISDGGEEVTIQMDYNSDKSLNSIKEEGESSVVFLYDNEDNLKNIYGGLDETLNVEELYESPYNAFEEGITVDIDENGNPSVLEFFEEEYVGFDYNSYTEIYEDKIYTATLSYDTAPNPFYHTLKSAGIIDVLDNVNLDFSGPNVAADIVKARALFPVNNLSKIEYKDEEGTLLYTINLKYVYDNQNYPTSVMVTATDEEDDYIENVISTKFIYED